MSKITDLLTEYEMTFEEGFPLMIIHPSEEELEKILTDCLKSGKPYEFSEKTKKMIADPTIDF